MVKKSAGNMQKINAIIKLPPFLAVIFLVVRIIYRLRICDLLKKMPSIVDKLSVKMVCVDDYAICKKYTYGTVMVDLESHRIIDIIDTCETKEVAEWLKTYPNIEVISRY